MHGLINEKLLLYKLHKGDAAAFAWLYDHFHQKLYRFVFLKVPTAQDTEDIVAEVFLKAWRLLSGKETKIRNLQAFLYQVTRNAVVDFYRKRGGNHETELDETHEMVIADRTDLTLEEKMILKSECALIERALRQLKDAYREVIVLRYLNELSLKEVAAAIERPAGATRVLLHRGLKALRSLLESLEHSRNS